MRYIQVQVSCGPYDCIFAGTDIGHVLKDAGAMAARLLDSNQSLTYANVRVVVDRDIP